MIIDTNGNILDAWWYSEGPLIVDRDNKYNMEFSIGVLYDNEQKEKNKRISVLKRSLADTDHKAFKFAEGEYTKEEYEPIRAQRAAWRAEINEIEKTFTAPTLTREEIDQAEDAAIERMKKIISEETTGQEVEEIVGDLGEEDECRN